MDVTVSSSRGQCHAFMPHSIQYIFTTFNTMLNLLE